MLFKDVFQFNYLQQLIDKHQETLKELYEVEKHLKSRFVGINEAIEATILSVLTGEPLLLIGPPGTTKSRLISETYKLLVTEPKEGDYFRYLLTRFTEPNELFGFFKIQTKHGDPVLERITDNMMQQARVVFLDEVFNASSAILNSLLTFMNEREFYDRGEKQAVNMQCLFGATNMIPYENDLRAVFDRFTLRCMTRNITVGNNPGLPELLHSAWQETYGRFDERDHNDIEKLSILYGGKETTLFKASKDLLDAVRRLQLDIKHWTKQGNLLPLASSSQFYKELDTIVLTLRQYDYSEMSNRRLVKMIYVMSLHSIYHHVNYDKQLEMGKTQLSLMRYAVDNWDNDLSSIIPLYKHAVGDDDKNSNT